MNNPHLTATVCFALAVALYFYMPSKEYASGFALLGMFFELSAWKKFLTRNSKKTPPSDQHSDVQ